MNKVQELLMSELYNYDEIIKQANLYLKTAPKERLRISKSGNSVQYYMLDKEETGSDGVTGMQSNLIMDIIAGKAEEAEGSSSAA